GLPADPVLAENLRDRNAVLAFFQDLDDLGFAKPRLPHEPSRLPRESLSLNCLSNGEAYGCTDCRLDRRRRAPNDCRRSLAWETALARDVKDRLPQCPVSG